MTDDAEKDRIGEVIGGRYRIDHLLGKGGQGHVFAATDLRDGEAVAVKTLSGPKAEDPEWRERMFREARAMVSLVGTSAVRVLDQKWSDRGELCLILERLHGRDFEDYLEQREAAGKPFSLAEVIDLLTPVALTLESAHAAGILHRDIKPSNIFITDKGEVRLLDFGFAKFISLRGLTRIGHVAGSPSYIAPEAWGGVPDTLDARVDVYGLAAVVFRALAGRPPFQAAKVYDLYRMVTEAKRPSLVELRPDLPADVDFWLEQSLAILPDHRFSSIRALWTSVSVLVSRASAPPGESTLPEPDDEATPIDLPSVDLESLEASSPKGPPKPPSAPDSVRSEEDDVPTERQIELPPSTPPPPNPEPTAEELEPNSEAPASKSEGKASDSKTAR